MKYYYKTKDGKGYLSLKSPSDNPDYIEITEEEFNNHLPQPQQLTAAQLARQEKLNRIAFLKNELARTDYQAIKYAEGWISAEDYAEMKAQRQAWRVEINQLESQIQ